MGEAESNDQHISLESTPTWTVATVCFVLIFVSILIEHGLHLLAKYFTKRRKMALTQALDKIKSDLMLLGFLSLLLTVCEKLIANICIEKKVAQSFNPCKNMAGHEEEGSKCVQQGKMSLMSRKGVQQLQMLLFFLAFFHVMLSFLTFSLGICKMRRWGSWEAETKTLDYQFSNDPRRFRFIHQTSFGRRHLTSWSEHQYLRLPACFIRQFYGSVFKGDYLTLRHGFVMAHLSEGSNFNFQKYIRRALENDFGVVVGISLWIWMFSMLFIFFNAYVFHNYFYLPFMPLVMLLVVGTKLQSIITIMCLDSYEKSHVVIGTILVKPDDHYFWLGRPKLLLHLMHFILFQNSFQLAFFAWSWYKFGLRSCFHRTTKDIVIRLVMGLIVHILCGYVTLPLYALVTQMGSSMRNAVFPESVVTGLKRWRARAKKNAARKSQSPTRTSLGTPLDASLDDSPSLRNLDVTLSMELGHRTSKNSVEAAAERNQAPELAWKFGELAYSFKGFELGRTHSVRMGNFHMEHN
ncbi:hypothetical protein LIER_01866 [Lithospermum erythrorhizon]|uniref:MLO-like protein n=1 Tax=Lithospermum erythrorhizon TaxID=34254 RepID=A0AAV3NMK3_LITER